MVRFFGSLSAFLMEALFCSSLWASAPDDFCEGRQHGGPFPVQRVNLNDALTNFPTHLLKHGISPSQGFQLGIYQLNVQGLEYAKAIASNYLVVWNTLSDSSKFKTLVNALNGKDSCSKLFYGTLASMDFNLDLEEYLESNTLQSLGRLKGFINSLSLSFRAYGKFRGQILKELFPNLTQLKLSECEVTDENQQLLDEVLQLRDKIPFFALEIQAESNSPEDLINWMSSDLSENVVSLSFDLSHVCLAHLQAGGFGPFSNLSHIYVNLCCGSHGLSFMETLKTLPYLVSLNVSGIDEDLSTKDLYEILKIISNVSSLRCLGLLDFVFPMDEEFPEVGYAYLDLAMGELSKLKELRILSLYNFDFGCLFEDESAPTPRAFEALAKGLRGLVHLTELDLDRIGLYSMDEEGATALGSSLAKMENLRKLSVNNNYILENEYHSRIWIEALPSLRHLSSLSISHYGEDGSPEGASKLDHFFETLGKLKTLHYLNIDMDFTEVQYPRRAHTKLLQDLPHLEGCLTTEDALVPFGGKGD